MNTTNNLEKTIVFNTPAELNLKLLFGELSIKFLPKVEFLLHQINRYHNDGGYQINSKNHCWFLGIKGTELATLINRLLGAEIIKRSKNYHPGDTSNTYCMVEPFDIAKSQKSFYKVSDFIFLQKWAADGYVVKNAATTVFKKEVSNAKALIIAQKEEIETLKKQLAELSQNVTNDTKNTDSTINLSGAVCAEVESQVESLSSNLDEVRLESQTNNNGDVAYHEMTSVNIGKLPDLIVEQYEGTLCIIDGDNIGCIQNFEDTINWHSEIPEIEKQKMYRHLMTEESENIRYLINRHTVANFKRVKDLNGTVFTYLGMAAA